MSLHQINFHSNCLGKKTSLNVILPKKIQEKYPIIFLLHGWSDDCNAWLNYTSLLRYVENYSFIVVLPEVDLSYYTNTSTGERYFDFLSEELPQYVQHWFPVTKECKHHFVAGLSMGGYGAFKWAFTYPKRFRAVASFSGAVDVVMLWETHPERKQQFSRIFGGLDCLKNSENDLNYVIEKNIEKFEHLDVYQSCGTEDFLFDINNQFYNRFEYKIPNFEYTTRSGDHNWDFWEYEVRSILERFNRFV